MDAPEQVNILIVDDEPRNLAVLESILDDPGYRLVRATSGDEALLALVSDDFAALVLDVQMPGMSGFELAQMVKERRKTARIPCAIHLSGKSEATCWSHGPTYFTPSPVLHWAARERKTAWVASSASWVFLVVRRHTPKTIPA